MTADHTGRAAPLRLIGLFGIALLALTGCSDSDSDADSEPDETQTQESPEGPADPESDSSAEDPDADAGAPPAMEEIEDDLWDAITEQDSVSMRVEQPEPVDDESSPGAPAESQEEQDQLVFDYSGHIHGEGSQLKYSVQGLEDTVLVFDDTGYQTVDGVVSDFESQVPPGQEAPFDPADFRAELESEGSWVEIDLDQAELQLTTADYVENVQGNMEEILGTPSLDSLDLSVETQTQDGTEVWVYSDDQYEITTTADVEEPLLMSIEITDSPFASTIHFSDWNESGSPESPPEEEIVDLDTVQRIVTRLLEE